MSASVISLLCGVVQGLGGGGRAGSLGAEQPWGQRSPSSSGSYSQDSGGEPLER